MVACRLAACMGVAAMALAAFAVTGCGDDAPGAATRLPTSGGGNGTGALPTGRTPEGDDAGVDPDSGAIEIDPVAKECEPVEDVGDIGETMATLLNTIDVPEDLVIGRVLTTWDGPCDEPDVVLTLSDGDCPDGDGHELTFRLAAADVREGSIRLGQNQIQPSGEGASIDVRYVRPDSLRPTGEWGNCTGAVGLIDLLGELSLERGSRLQGRFQLDLTACDDSGNPPFTITGQFSGVFKRGVDELCR